MTIDIFEASFSEYLHIMETVPLLPFMESPLEGWFVEVEAAFTKHNVINTKLKCYLLKKFLERVLETIEMDILNKTLNAVGELPLIFHTEYEVLKDHLLMLWPDTYNETKEELNVFLFMEEHYEN